MDTTLLINYVKVSESHSVMSNSLQPMNYTIYRSWNSPGQNTGVGRLSILQGIFPTQESNWGLLCCRWILYQLSYEGSPTYTSIKKKQNKTKQTKKKQQQRKLAEQASRWHNKQAAHYCQSLVSFQKHSWPLS